MSTMTRFCRLCGLTSPCALPTIFSYWPTFGHENPPKVGDSDRAASISIRVMRASAGDAANSAAASNPTKLVPNVRMPRGTAKNWLMDDPPWQKPLPLTRLFLLRSPERRWMLNRCYAGDFAGSTDFPPGGRNEATVRNRFFRRRATVEPRVDALPAENRPVLSYTVTVRPPHCDGARPR